MADYKKRQEEGFIKLKEILQNKETTETIQSYVKRLDNMFKQYIIIDLKWDTILHECKKMEGNKLENFMLKLTTLVESYDED